MVMEEQLSACGRQVKSMKAEAASTVVSIAIMGDALTPLGRSVICSMLMTLCAVPCPQVAFRALKSSTKAIRKCSFSHNKSPCTVSIRNVVRPHCTWMAGKPKPENDDKGVIPDRRVRFSLDHARPGHLGFRV